jgi:hypothetical protein
MLFIAIIPAIVYVVGGNNIGKQNSKEISALRQDMKEGFEKVDKQFASVRQEMNDRFEKVDERFEKMDERLRNLEIDVGEIRGVVISGRQPFPERYSNNPRRKRVEAEAVAEEQPAYGKD